MSNTEVSQILQIIQTVVSVLTFIAACIGGWFALIQWRKGNYYRRGEIVRNLIDTIRCDEDIAAVMDIIDWDDGFCYDGGFVLSDKSRSALSGISDADFFHKIDKSLAHFSYICYLYDQKILTKKDIFHFEYNLRRIMDNAHIRNYLFSLYHWSRSMDVKMSFHFLVEYGLQNGHLLPSFRNCYSNDYECRLEMPLEYMKKEAIKM